MRTIFAVFSSLTLVVFAAKGDYIIKQEVETMGHVQQISMKIKDAKARLDTEQTSTIIDSSTGETIMLIHGQKVFLKIAPEQLKAQQSINGYETEEYVTSLNGTDMSIFISKDFPDFMKIIEAVNVIQKGPGMDIFRTMAISPTKYPGMPIRTEAKFLGQRVVVTLESVQQTDLTEADFSLPVDYKELNPGGLPGKTNPSQ